MAPVYSSVCRRLHFAAGEACASGAYSPEKRASVHPTLSRQHARDRRAGNRPARLEQARTPLTPAEGDPGCDA